ncbi:MAG: putative 60S ribosomal protein L18a [Streblomastix strix]|uniref:60S ribosomal protein L18a n=1 Tax=Streblomastix strix TaxID=222440 RepID=A0A5J4X586_9EUKA|nr:MAG: putative 60S ribosomal protein L18a [Streblomastix strix]
MPYKQFQILGRHYPTEKKHMPRVFKMKLFAPNVVVAQSRFNYYLTRMQKIKRSKCQILKVEEIREKKPLTVKNYGILLKYDSRTGTHNVYKEYRDITIGGAVDQMYNEMASRHAAHKTTIHIISAVRLTSKLCKRPNVTAFHSNKLKFPLLHRRLRATTKDYRTVFKAKKPSTNF